MNPMLGAVRRPGFSKTARSHVGHREAARNRFDLGAIAVFAGRDPDNVTKCAAEGAEAVEADIEADVGDASLGLAQLEHRALDPPALEVAVRCLAEGRTERPYEVGFGDARNLGEVGDVERVGVRTVDRVSCPQHAAIRLLDGAAHVVQVSSYAMASWAEFEAAEPEFAARVGTLMSTHKHLTMATLRRDGSPRISGTEVEFADGQLRLGSMPGAVKALDLRRDGRVAIHGPTADPPADNAAGWKGEAKIAGIAHEVDSGGDAHRFEIDISEVVITRLNEAGNRLVVESWTRVRGYRTMERE